MANKRFRRILILLMSVVWGISCARREEPSELPSLPALRLTFRGENRDATWSPDGKQIAFASNRDGPHDLWVMEVPVEDRFAEEDTTFAPEDLKRTARNLTHNRVFDRYPAWSPDGRWIAYLSTPGLETEVWIVPAEGGEARPVTQDGRDKDGMVSWSPEGTQIAFAAGDGEYNIWVIDLATREERRLTGNPGRDWLPSWSPDGGKIAFASDRAGSEDIWVLDVASGGLQQLTDWSSNERSPSWSPDGRWIAFTSWAEGNWDIWVIPASGGNAVQITQTPESEFVPRWSPDGRRIAFHRISGRELVLVSTSGEDPRWVLLREILGLRDVAWSPDGGRIALAGISMNGQGAIWTMDLSDGKVTHLVQVYASTLSWSPDGREIAFTRSKGGKKDIWAVSSSGGRPRQITIDRGEDWWPTWSPDGSEIAFVSDRAGSLDIWAIPSTGGNPRRITSEEDVYQPIWSSDGRWIAFVASAREGWEIRRVPAEGGRSTRLTSEHRGVPLLIWGSKEEGKLFYAKLDLDGDQRVSLWKIAFLGGPPSLVTLLPKDIRGMVGCALSPDGEVLAIGSPTRADIWMMKVSGITE